MSETASYKCIDCEAEVAAGGGLGLRGRCEACYWEFAHGTMTEALEREQRAHDATKAAVKALVGKLPQCHFGNVGPNECGKPATLFARVPHEAPWYACDSCAVQLGRHSLYSAASPLPHAEELRALLALLEPR